MDTKEREKIIKKVIDGIIDNLSDQGGFDNDNSYKKVTNNQKGLGDVWDEMDDEAQEELKKEWQAIFRKFLPVTVKK